MKMMSKFVAIGGSVKSPKNIFSLLRKYFFKRRSDGARAVTKIFPRCDVRNFFSANARQHENILKFFLISGLRQKFVVMPGRECPQKIFQ